MTDYTNKLNSDYAYVRPFVFKKQSVTRTCIKMIGFLLVEVCLLAAYGSYSALINIGCAVGASLLAYLIFFIHKKEVWYTSFMAVLQGLLFGMLLPETYPPLAAFFVVFILMSLVRCIFQGIYNIWANVICFGVVIAWVIGKSFFPDFLLSQDLIGMRNSSLYLIQNGDFPVSSFDSSVTAFLNNTVFKILKVSVPEGYVSMLWDSHSTIPAFRFNVINLLASVILFADESLDYMITGIFLLVYCLLVRLFVPFIFGGAFNSGDIILALFSSGLLFSSVFVMQWIGTMPSSKAGKLVYAFLMGIITFLIVGCGTSGIGFMYCILSGNIVTVVIRVIENRNDSIRILKQFKNTKGEIVK